MADSEVQQIESADAVIGLVPPPSRDGQSMESTIARLVETAVPVKIALVHPPLSSNHTGSLKFNSHWHLIASPQLVQDPSALAQSLGDSFRATFDIALKLNSRACAVVASDLSTSTADWVGMLLQPVIEEQFDLVAPCYARHPFEGMISRAIAYPLVRALYGKRIRNPLGPDFGISSRLLSRVSEAPRGRLHSLPSLAAEAITNAMPVCQSHLGTRIYSMPDVTNLSSLLAQVLGPLFLDVEKYAAHWQRARGSEPIREFGTPLYVEAPEGAIDVSRLIDSFQLGARNLQEVWSMILPPSTLVELRRLARNGAAQFRMPDVTWAQVVYDFALAHRLRTISRDQMLRALTPIYLGWLASYAQELGHASPQASEQRLEQLCVVYEETKSYFVSRWRWPDRFNP
jgi:glucosylglycerate synthase